MSSIEQQTAKQLANIERSTGRSLAEWTAIIEQSGLEKHGQLVAMLKDQYGLGHGNANLLVSKAREAVAGGALSDSQLIDSHYAGRNARLRALYEAVLARVQTFGSDIELDAKKTYVSLRRRKQFGQVGPAAGQLEVGLNLPGKEPTERLRPTSGMATHRVRIGDAAGIDDELIGWLREAYDRA
jgi:predicted transport protein